MGWLLFIIGALSNRFIRGGDIATKLEGLLINQWPEFGERIKFIVSADLLNVIIFLIALLSFTNLPALNIVLLVAAMWIGSAPTWGEYIGSMFETRTGDFTRNAVFDFIPNLALDIGLPDAAAGAIGLLLRGAFWGGLLALASFSFAPLFVGSFMPLVYILSHKVSEKFNFAGGWTIGEFIFGGLLWISIL